MANLFKNKYRIESTRLKGWEFRWNAAYFITICTADIIIRNDTPFKTISTYIKNNPAKWKEENSGNIQIDLKISAAQRKKKKFYLSSILSITSLNFSFFLLPIKMAISSR